MYKPVSTYRIQFNKDFTLTSLQAIIPYLKELGIKTIYASPIFESVPGSTHGYDTINPAAINPEVGTLDELRKVYAVLKNAGIGWIQDIVPNHMAYHPANPWLADVLLNGAASAYAKYFDILDFPLMAPFLGSSVEEAIVQGDLTIGMEKGKRCFSLYGALWPLNTAGLDLPAVIDKSFIARALESQNYRFCHWQETDTRINYRRFFTVNGLIGLNIQRKEVFDDFHKFALELLKEGLFDGLRIDHIDGLYDPDLYLSMLRAAAGPDTYLIVEKILAYREPLSHTWPVQGTTGYDFLGTCNSLFVKRAAEEKFTALYTGISGDYTPPEKLAKAKKKMILDRYMGGEFEYLYSMLLKSDVLQDSYAENDIRRGLAEFLVKFPVYRYYLGDAGLTERQKEMVGKLRASADSGSVEHTLWGALLDAEQLSTRAGEFFRRCMQYTGPLTAKGIEDTLMYSYPRLLSLNEVGGSPEHFGLPMDQFHKEMENRGREWPAAMNTLSTHDTKRGEDARARLNAITANPEAWEKVVLSWLDINQGLFPDKKFEYLIYQSLLASFPLPGIADPAYRDRLAEYLIKAAREAKERTNWSMPDQDYEAAISRFVTHLCTEGEFLRSFRKYHQTISEAGIINSLAQTVLKYTCPGIPDTYQGSEGWDWSFVDPDNRRPVDYTRLHDQLTALPEENKNAAAELWPARRDGRIKTWLVRELLKMRTQDDLVFEHGTYRGITVSGEKGNNICAFTRSYDGITYLVAVPLFPALAPGLDRWKNTMIVLPQGLPSAGVNCLTGEAFDQQGELPLSEAFGELPVAVLRFKQKENKRGAGILMHISSLPSAFGTGDFGPQAYRFADFLHAAGQKYWQVLPLNPTSKVNGHSPYSSFSAFGGNLNFISPELLQEEGLIKSCYDYMVPPADAADFGHAEKIKLLLLREAYESARTNGPLSAEFDAFCLKEEYWLTDFANYVLLKEQYYGNPWFEWPEAYANRDALTMDRFQRLNSGQLSIIKWIQFIFTKQWKALKAYCNNLDIKIIGDLPLYVSHDSADVWSRRDLFDLDSGNQVSGIAGVPPDYFNAEGQLWGMPVYRWDELAETNYDWWAKRVGKNLEFFDLVRIDHFRAFSAYWRVAAGSENAVKGQWVPGPGESFFDFLAKEFPGLPFIAEDLGEINDSVYALRDKYGLPGMKVMQFSFGDDMPDSIHSLHHHTSSDIVYTGTHDNNTTRGWYRRDADKATRRRVSQYFGRTVSERNISQILIRAALSSVGRTAIVPMQDVLGLTEQARMNEPASTAGNWQWRMTIKDLQQIAKSLKELTILYGRL